MKPVLKYTLIVLSAILLQSCFLYAVYGVYRTIQDINNVLTLVNTSLLRINTVINEGRDLKRVAKDGTLIVSLAEEIPKLIQVEVEKRIKEKINRLSADLKLSALEFTRNAIEENLSGAKKAYNEMAETYNGFGELLDEMSRAASQGKVPPS